MRIDVTATLVNQASGGGVLEIALFTDGNVPYVEFVSKGPTPTHDGLPDIGAYRRIKASEFVAVASAIIAAVRDA